MKQRKVIEFGKNAVGTVFLLAAAFFVCSTFMSIKTVFADPIAPVATQKNISATSSRGTSRSASTVARTTSSRGASRGASAISRTISPRSVNNAGVATRSVSSRVTTSSPRTASSSSRGVTSRTTARNVVSRSATMPNTARVSLISSGTRAPAGTNTYTILSSKLYTGNYSNIIDSTTGLISADAYSTCLESYYTCMDEICTARSETKGRCSCAGRAIKYIDAEEQLEIANEELINLSGQLALLIATKGKDVSSAFQLTDAEKVMNCVSYKDAKEVAGSTKDADGKTISQEDYMKSWCQNHMMYDNSKCSYSTQPAYCSSTGEGANTFGFDISKIDGSSSDILASLQAWASAKDSAKLYKPNDDESVLSAVSTITNTLAGLNIKTDGMSDTENKDSLRDTWGYKLFEYAHNNVCGRVLDSCFNGIYEACGTPPSVGDHKKCQNGQSTSCPYNFNSYISATNGDVVLNTVNKDASVVSTAQCFGYSTSKDNTSDPYASLRGPVAEARRSIMQKYLLDANAACDAYGSALQQTAQNIAYQKVAAQQALQQKRLEFVQQEEAAIASSYSSAISNMNKCLSELYDCYTTQETANTSWSTSRIKTYCMQISNVPHCYETMVCGTPGNFSTLQAVIDKADSETCNASDVYSENTCRNIVTISEVLSGDYATGAAEGNSKQYREKCLKDIGIEGVRSWARTGTGTSWPDSNPSQESN